MTWQPGDPWRVARCLLTLRSEVNAAAPTRSTRSDGTIGDASHLQRVSEHNPNQAGVVTAVDLTHDPAGGLDCEQLADFLTAKAHSYRVWYVVWNQRICSRTSGWAWKPYTGADPHTSHLHLSTQQTPDRYDDPASWGWTGDADMLTDSDIKRIAAAAAEAVWGRRIEVPGSDPAGTVRASTMLKRILNNTRLILTHDDTPASGLTAAQIAQATADAVADRLTE